MTIEALSLTLCLVSGVFGRPSWSPEKCQERAEQIMQIASENELDPLLFVAINIQECDQREDVHAPFFAKTSGRRKPVQLGIDACPMGVRIWWPHGQKSVPAPEARVMYELAGKKMSRLKKWCEKRHKHHHFVSHWNEGNKTYASQVLAFRTTLLGKSPTDEAELTPRTKEIVRRLQRAQRAQRDRKS